jgi:hypothetical protein
MKYQQEGDCDKDLRFYDNLLLTNSESWFCIHTGFPSEVYYFSMSF